MFSLAFATGILGSQYGRPYPYQDGNILTLGLGSYSFRLKGW